MKKQLGRLLLVSIFTTLLVQISTSVYAGFHFGIIDTVKRKVEDLEKKKEESLNRPPTISLLVANPSSVSPGSTSVITCTASDPDGDPLTYTWTKTGGTISGTGSQVTWTAPAATGTYTITCTVSDGKGGTATKSVDVSVISEEIHYGDLIISGSNVYKIENKTLRVKGKVVVKDNAKLIVKDGKLLIEQTADNQYTFSVEGKDYDRPYVEFENSTFDSNYKLDAYFNSFYNDIKFNNSLWKANITLRWTGHPNVYISNSTIEGKLYLANDAQVYVTNSNLVYVWQDCCTPDMWLTNSKLDKLDFGSNVKPYSVCYVNNSRIDWLNKLKNAHGKIYVYNGSTIGKTTEDGPNHIEIIYGPPPAPAGVSFEPLLRETYKPCPPSGCKQ